MTSFTPLGPPSPAPQCHHEIRRCPTVRPRRARLPAPRLGQAPAAAPTSTLRSLRPGGLPRHGPPPSAVPRAPRARPPAEDPGTRAPHLPQRPQQRARRARRHLVRRPRQTTATLSARPEAAGRGRAFGRGRRGSRRRETLAGLGDAVAEGSGAVLGFGSPSLRKEAMAAAAGSPSCRPSALCVRAAESGRPPPPLACWVSWRW